MSERQISADHRKVLMINDLVVQRPLGSGFQGHVYAVRHPAKSIVAVKISDSTSDIPEAMERNHHEFEILKSGDGSINLLTAYDCTHYLDKETGIQYHWFTMELCRGNLLEFIDKMSLAERVKIAYALLNTLAYLHRKRTSHRDIKLNNLLLDQNNRLRLGDFGTAKVITRPADQVGLGVPYVLGTVPYFASELWKVLDGTLTGAINWFLSDEYAAGVCCYQILCRGRLPPRLEQCAALGESSQVQNAMRSAHLGGIFFPVRVPEHPGRVLTQVDRVLQRMLSINPQNRYGNMTECALAMVTAFINHELMTLGGC